MSSTPYLNPAMYLTKSAKLMALGERRHRPTKYLDVCGRQYSNSSAKLRITFSTSFGSLIESEVLN